MCADLQHQLQFEWHFCEAVHLFKDYRLFDTVLFLLAKKLVIAFQMLTVLSYCWHSYANGIAICIWFTATGYTFHVVTVFVFRDVIWQIAILFSG